MSNNNKGRGFGGKGYYIALILCAAVIGITGYVYYRNLQEPQEVLMEENKILVVDDEQRMRKLVKDFLVKQNFRVL